MTDLDNAHAAMEAAPDDDAVRLRFYERLADTELFMLLGEEAADDQITPELFEIEDQSFSLVFDREERLSQFVGRAAPYAGLPGRTLVQMLAGQGIGLALNLDVAPSAMLIPAEAVDWLVATLANAPDETEARLTEVSPPVGLPEAVVTGLDRKLAIAAGMARFAYLAAATYEDGVRGHVLAFVDAAPGAEKALASAAGEALTFSGIEAGVMDVLFVRAADPLAARLARVGLRFDLPELAAAPQAPGAPGMDPDKPPRLR
ncbi:SseB family protein [Yoonia sp.]|uniref:SseB family protein n=1 Tax=Yoonia sp. TaxID=2212373 RepID=UPI0025ED9696|nr:SseB family protein [Yoonia sp.]